MSTEKNTRFEDHDVERAAARALALSTMLWERLLEDDGEATIGGTNSATLAAVAESVHRELEFLTDRLAEA